MHSKCAQTIIALTVPPPSNVGPVTVSGQEAQRGRDAVEVPRAGVKQSWGRQNWDCNCLSASTCALQGPGRNCRWLCSFSPGFPKPERSVAARVEVTHRTMGVRPTCTQVFSFLFLTYRRNGGRRKSYTWATQISAQVPQTGAPQVSIWGRCKFANQHFLGSGF